MWKIYQNSSLYIPRNCAETNFDIPNLLQVIITSNRFVESQYILSNFYAGSSFSMISFGTGAIRENKIS